MIAIYLFIGFVVVSLSWAVWYGLRLRKQIHLFQTSLDAAGFTQLTNPSKSDTWYVHDQSIFLRFEKRHEYNPVNERSIAEIVTAVYIPVRSHLRPQEFVDQFVASLSPLTRSVYKLERGLGKILNNIILDRSGILAFGPNIRMYPTSVIPESLTTNAVSSATYVVQLTLPSSTTTEHLFKNVDKIQRLAQGS